MSAFAKIAVVGTGPAGLGVITALLDGPRQVDVTVFDIGQPLRLPMSEPLATREGIRSYYDEIYAEVRNRYPYKFPPPKTHFAEQLPKFLLDGREAIFKAQSMGGLSNFWGAGTLPFSSVEFEKWPFGRAAMDRYYERMAEVIGIAGQPDALNEYYGADFANRPAIHLPSIARRLDECVNQRVEKPSQFRVISGVSRCAVETRPDRTNTCQRCGECLSGCFAGSIFSAGKTVKTYFEQPGVRLVKGRVRAFDASRRSLDVECDGQRSTFSGFDRIYLAAGCPNTTELCLRSLGLACAEDMADNAVFVFPIFHLGERDSDNDMYLSLCNLIWALVPEAPERRFAQVSIYLNFDYMWRYNIPNRFWPYVEPLVRYSRSRLLWARLYTHGDDSQSYSVTLEDDAITFHRSRAASPSAIDGMMDSIRAAVNRRGFFVPPIPPLLQKSNSHYACTLPMGGSKVSVDAHGAVAPGIHLCDSSIFPDLPAASPTFTIMANAYRIAAETS